MKQNVFTKFISLLMALIMVIGMVPTTAFHAHAEGENPLLVIANSGYSNKEFTSFTDAVAYATNYGSATIQLQSDHTHAERLILKPNYDPTLTIDLNGHHLTLSAGLEVTTSCSLIITDTGDTKGSLTINGGNFSPVVLNPDDRYVISLTIDGATLKTEDNYTFINCYCPTAYFEDTSAVFVDIKNAFLSGDDLISAGGNTRVTIKNSTMAAQGTVLDMNNNGMIGPSSKEPTKFASASVENSILSGDYVITMDEGTSLIATGTATASCIIDASASSGCPVSASKNTKITMTGVTVRGGGLNNIDLSGGTGSFTGCTFDDRISLSSSATATYTDCTFGSSDAFYISRDAQAVCIGCSEVEPDGIDSSYPGGLIVWNADETVATVYGEVTLTENLTIPEGVTYNFVTYQSWNRDIPAKLVLGDYTVTNNGTIQIDGAVHTHSGEETVESKNDTHHHTKTVCTDCPIGYVGYTDEQPHSINTVTGLCTVCNTNAAVASVTQGENTVYFATFEEAVTAVGQLAETENISVKLLKDVGSTAKLTLPAKTFTLDLNGKTLTQSGMTANIEIAEGGSLTVTDSSEEKSGTVYFTGSSFIVPSGTSLKLDSGTIEASEYSYSFLLDVNGTFEMTGGTVTHGNANARSVNAHAGSNLKISGGEVSYLYVPTAASDSLACTVALRGGNFTKITAIASIDIGIDASCLGYTLAPGCYFQDAQGNKIENPNSGSGTLQNVTVACGHAGGTADCQNQATCVTCGKPYGELGDHGNIDKLTGNCGVCGEFAARICVTLGETTLYYGDDIRTALAEIGSLAGTETVQVKLLADVTDNNNVNYLVFPVKNISLELNGKTLTQSAASQRISISGGGSLTVTDSSEEKTGTIYAEGGFAVPSGSALTLHSGTITTASTNTDTALYVSGTFEMTGGAVRHPDASEWAIYMSSYSTTKISGGEVSYLYASTNEEGLACTVALRGGSYGKVQARRSIMGAHYSALSGLLAPGCYFQDAQGNEITNIGHSTEGVLTNVTVVCGHIGGTADCQNQAACTTCGESYGELGDHGAVDVTTGTCSVPGCGEFLATVTVTQNGITTYYLDVESALAAVTGKATIQLLKDSTIPRSANGEFDLPVQDVTLDLNGKTLSADKFVHVPSGGIFTLTDTTQAQTGKLSTWRLTVNSGAELVLTGGTVYGSNNNTASMEVSGKLTMTGGAVEHVATNSSVYVQDNAEVAISGGSVSSLLVSYPAGAFAPLSEVALSGGTFGYIKTGVRTDLHNDGTDVEEILADGYKFVDATSGADVDAGVRSIENVKVVCAHPANFPGSTAADCQNKAYCAQCGESYGETLPHKINAEDGYCQYGCGEFVAVATVIVYGSSRSSFASFADAIEYVEGLAIDDHITIFLHTNTTYDKSWVLPEKSIQLNLQGNTLEMSSITNNYSNKNLYISSTTGEGLLKLTSPNGGIHLGGGNVTLLSGNIQATADNAIVVSSGRFTVNGGTIRSDTGHGIYVNASTAKVNITGGTIQGGSNSYALYRNAAGTVTLSGGIFLGGINATPNNGTTNNIVDLVADDYGAFYYDAENQSVGTAVPTDLSSSTSDIIVACVHTMDHADDLDATCVKAAYCGNCQQYYGEENPDNHDLSLTANDVADVITLTCNRECGYEKQVKLTVPTDAVYDGGPHNATADGSIPGYSAVITYYQNGEELNESPTLPGRYTAKLFLAEQPQYSLSADFSIARATITPYVSVGEGYKKTYDGTTEMPYNTMMVQPTGEDLLGNHNVELNGTWEFTSAEAGTTEVTVKITLSGKDAHLYQLSTDTLTGDWGKILPAPLDITADDTTITYGDDAPAFTVKYEGFVPGEDEGVLGGQLNFNCAYDTSYGPRRSAGTYTITPGGLTSNNYTITFQDGALEVKPRQIIAMMDDKVVTYGDDAPEYTWIYDGLVYDDTAEDVTNIRFNGTSAYVPGQTQAGDTVPIMAENLEAVSGNYILTYITEGDLTVMKRPVTASIDGDETKYYDGTDSVAVDLPLVLSNIYAADNLFVTGDFAFGQAEAGENIPIIASNLTLDGTDKDNYYLPRHTCSANVGTILPAPLDITADDKTITYGDAAPAFTVKYEGFAPGEDEGVLDGELTFTTAYDVTDPNRRGVTNYGITPGGLTSSNYKISFIDGLLWVERAPVTLLVDEKSVVYGDSAPDFTYDFAGLKYEDDAYDVRAGFELYSNYTPETPAGTKLPIQIRNMESHGGNYAVDQFSGADLTVTKRPVELSLTGEAVKTYDGTNAIPADHTLSLILTNVRTGDDVKVSGNFSYGWSNAGENISIFANTLTLSGKDASNYYLYTPVAMVNTGRILPLDISGLDITAGTLYYNGKEQTAKVTVPDIDGLTPTYEVTGNKATNVGVYTLTVTGTGNFTGKRDVQYLVDVDTSALDVLQNTNLTSDLLPDIQDILDALATIDPAHTNADQQVIWDTLEDNCQNYKKQIEDAQAAADTPAINAVQSVTKDNVTKDDKAALEQAQKDLTGALENHSSVYTEDERQAITTALTQLEDALEALNKVNQAESALSAVPNNLTSSDMDEAKNALVAYESLSDHEKTLLGEETAKRMKELNGALTEYEKNILRISGSNRYQTAINAAYELKASLGGNPFGSVIVARGDCFADALSAGYLADQKDAPILLVNEKTMDMVKAFIRSNTAQGGTVYILGGPEAISPSMESGLESYTVKRLAGTDRYETNLAILKEAGVAGKNLIVCNGGDYPDALSAAALGCPIMLVRNDLTSAQQELLSSTSKQVYIIGGTKAVSTQAEKTMAKQGCTVTRVAGADRYETSAQLAQSVFPNTNSVVLVSGKNYPDALCAGPLARQLGAPVILTAPGKEAAVEKYLADKDVTSAYILGGPKALPYNSADALLEGN